MQSSAVGPPGWRRRWRRRKTRKTGWCCWSGRPGWGASSRPRATGGATCPISMPGRGATTGTRPAFRALPWPNSRRSGRWNGSGRWAFTPWRRKADGCIPTPTRPIPWWTCCALPWKSPISGWSWVARWKKSGKRPRASIWNGRMERWTVTGLSSPAAAWRVRSWAAPCPATSCCGAWATAAPGCGPIWCR